MPVINITVSDDDYRRLQDEYRKMALAWPRLGRTALPPSFEEWVGERAAAACGEEVALADVRMFSAVEQTITSLQAHGYGLAHLGRQGATQQESAQAYADSLVRNLRLSPQQLKRIGELLGYYAKSAKEIADAAHVGVTNRAYGALHEACRELIERTEGSIERLGEQRAVGRVEGAVAVLVSMNAMDREAAKDRTGAFKLRARNPGRRTE